MATINEIKQQAEAVKNASQVGENTAERVGGALAALADFAEQQDYKLSDLSNNIIGFSKSFTFNKVDSYIVSLSDVKFKEGQYACIMVKTTPAISTVYNGNATNMGEPYPNISITDGFGFAVVGPATSNNAFLGNFGYGSASLVPIEHTVDFTILVMESADELPIKVLTKKNAEDIQKNAEDIQKNTEELNLKYILKANSVSFDFSKTGSSSVANVYTKVVNAGQYIRVRVKTTPAIDTTYNGVTYNMNMQYPALVVKNGIGEVVVGPAISSEGTVNQFGYGKIDYIPSDHKAEFIMEVIDSPSDRTLKNQVEKDTADIQKNTEDIDKIKKSINEPLDSFSKSFTFDKESNIVVSLDGVKFKKGQYAMLLAKTTPAITTTYNGNAANMGERYPSIRITDGFGEIILGPATSDGASLLAFGYGSASLVPIEHTVDFTVLVMESSDKIPVKIQVQKNTDDIQKNTEDIQKNTEDIQKNTIGWQEENIPSLLETPFEHNFRVPGYTAIIRSWGFIGDSLCSGEMECFEGETRKFVDMYEYSWGQQICRLCGSEGYNYSNGGQTAQGWIYSQERGWGKAKTNPHQAYIIALGVNDASQATKGNIETDVDFDNYENNANTFAGNYCGIIQRIRSVSQRSIIFVVSDPKNNELNEIIKATPSKFKNVFLIDLTSLIPLYSNAEFNKKYKMNGHLNAAGYLFTAYMFMHYIDYIIQNNPAIFTDIALWNTNYTAQAT